MLCGPWDKLSCSSAYDQAVNKPSEPPARGSPADLRQKAMAHYKAGRMHDAVQAQVAALNAAAARNGPGAPEDVEDLSRLGLFLFALGDFPSAVSAMERARALAPRDPEVLANLGVVLTRSGRYEDAIRTYLEARRLAPEDPNVLDGLATAHGDGGKFEESHRYGEESLTMKDRQSMGAMKDRQAMGAMKDRQSTGSGGGPPDEPPRRFDPARPEQNVIAFSLWGDAPRYLDGALRNVEAADRLYPGWRCRFYLDPTVPEGTVKQLASGGVDIVRMPRHRNFYEGLFWRFRVAEDDTVRRFLVRDCDAVINPREQAAVEEWLSSDRYFHVMRDYYTHTELILAGLWGGVGGILPIGKLITDFTRSGAGGAIVRTIDQIFLRRMVWPLVRGSLMTHDDRHRVLGARDFPSHATLPAGRHVGQDDDAVRKRVAK